MLSNRHNLLFFLIILASGLTGCRAETTTPIPTPTKTLLPSPTLPTETPPLLATTELDASPTVSPAATPTPLCWTQSSNQLEQDFLLIGYLPEYRELNPGWGACLTDLIYFSAVPTADGKLDTSGLSITTLAAMRQMKLDQGIRLHLSLGGYGRNGGFSEMVVSLETRSKFVDNLVEFATEYDLDGIDLDWEFPQTPQEIDGYRALILQIQRRGFLVSVALYPYDDLDVGPYLGADRIYIMSYDRGIPHATFEQAVADVEFFKASGVPSEKLFLGVPFYGRRTVSPHTSFAYQEINAQYSLSPDMDEIDSIYFNGPETLQRKACFARQNDLGGIMIWELGQDSQDANSLLHALYISVLNPLNCK